MNRKYLRDNNLKKKLKILKIKYNIFIGTENLFNLKNIINKK